MPHRTARIFVAAALLTLVGCSAGPGTILRDSGPGGDIDATVDGDDGGPGADTGTPGVDGGPLATPDSGWDAGPIDREAFCMGEGPVVLVGDASETTETCVGSIATRVFDNALCSCEDTNIVGYLRTRSFDSSTGGGEADSGAPVGVNGEYLTGGYAKVGGSFVVGGPGGIEFGGYLEVYGDARFNGDVDAIGYIEIKRDLWVQGDVTNIGLLDVDGDVHQPSGSSLSTLPRIGGSRISTPFTIDPPCACEPSELVDIDAIIADARTENDNADVGLDPNILANIIGLSEEIVLPCGRYYLTSIGGLGDVTVRITGRTALFVEGDVNAIGIFDIELEPDGELDLFIGGSLLQIGGGSYGDPSQPAKTRIYVGGTGDVTIVGAAGFVGNVYAPHARIIAAGATSVYGSLFGREIDMPGYLDIHYDRAILDVDEDCDPPPSGECGCGIGEGCTDHRACIGGECAACRNDADCCDPLVCYPDGTCGPLLI